MIKKLTSSFSIQFNRNNSKKLTAQEEYWLNRILRDHAWQIFVVTVLFLVLMIIAVVYDNKQGQTVKQVKEVNIININNVNTKSESWKIEVTVVPGR